MTKARPTVAKGERGTTLLELMMGLVILTIITSIAIPAVSSLVRRQNLRQAGEDLVYAAEQARSRARSQRRAYGVLVGNGGGATDPLKVQLLRGKGTTCASIIGGQVVAEFDHGQGNLLNNPNVKVVAKAPQELSSPGVFPCFKPDGRVLRSDSGTPFSPPSGLGHAAGDVFFELRRVDGTGTEVGDRLQVQITYSGNARLTHGYPLADLQGGS